MAATVAHVRRYVVVADHGSEDIVVAIEDSLEAAQAVLQTYREANDTAMVWIEAS